MIPKMQKIATLAFLIGMSTAYASTYHGVIHEIRIAATSSGGTRVSVLSSGTTDCGPGNAINHWYSFEYSPTGPGAAWLAALLSAKITQASIIIQGTGTCDASGMETVSSIDLP
jgi:hypothetical protein